MSTENQTGFAYAAQAALGYLLDATGVGVDSGRGQRYVGFANECLDRAESSVAGSSAEYEVVQSLRQLADALRTGP